MCIRDSTYKIYRKTTTTDMDIHNTSNHPTQHKHAAFNHMLHRLTKIPLSKQDYNDELLSLIHIFFNYFVRKFVVNAVLFCEVRLYEKFVTPNESLLHKVYVNLICDHIFVHFFKPVSITHIQRLQWCVLVLCLYNFNK